MFPARAGMSPIPNRELMRRRCVPRASGDEPDKDIVDAVWLECSPRERG